MSGLESLRKSIPQHLIGKLPKPTKQQTEDVKADFKKGIRCNLCGAWHHKDVVHIDYLGHAALTHMLLDADPAWFWEPMAITEHGLPRYDDHGGLWIRLTVCGTSRLGYGNADNATYKDAGQRDKEVIGDALRNAAMRFGAALELWHKGDLYLDLDQQPNKENENGTTTQPAKTGEEYKKPGEKVHEHHREKPSSASAGPEKTSPGLNPAGTEHKDTSTITPTDQAKLYLATQKKYGPRELQDRIFKKYNCPVNELKKWQMMEILEAVKK